MAPQWCSWQYLKSTAPALALWKRHHVIMNQLNWKYTGIREASAEQEEVDFEEKGSMETRQREFEAPM